nr:very short patch repair endonuclease [Lentzea terrae]
MRRTRRTGTAPELAVRRALHRRGLRYLVDVAPPGTNRRRRVDVLLRGGRSRCSSTGASGTRVRSTAKCPRRTASGGR